MSLQASTAYLLRAAGTLSRWAMWGSGALILIMALYIVADVFSRALFNYSLHSDELSGYAFAISVSWAFSFAALQRTNVRIDALYQMLPVRVCALLDWVSLVSLAVFIVYVTRYAVNVATTSWVNHSIANTTLSSPLWIPQSLWAAGFVWLCIVLALMLLRASTALVCGDVVTVRLISGIRSIQEEAKEEALAGEQYIHGGRK